MESQQTLATVFAQRKSFDDVSAICPNCGAFVGFQHIATQGCAARFIDRGPRDGSAAIHLARCRSCNGGVIGAVEAGDAMLIWPGQGWPDKSPPDLDEAFKADYDEARAVLPHSAKAAAVLTRRCLQSILRHKMNVKPSNLYNEIEEASKSDLLSKPAGDALHHVREIGNIGAHAKQSAIGEDETDPALTLVEVKPNEAAYTLQVLEMLFNDLYVVPTQQAEMQAQLASK